jgi:hypothetical protein
LPDRLRPAGAGGLSLLRRERSPVRCRGRSRAAGGARRRGKTATSGTRPAQSRNLQRLPRCCGAGR